MTESNPPTAGHLSRKKKKEIYISCFWFQILLYVLLT